MVFIILGLPNGDQSSIYMIGILQKYLEIQFVFTIAMEI